MKEVGKLDEIHLRVVENAKGKFIDVSEWVVSDTYTGWSKKGVRFRADQAGTLLRLIADACVVVDEGDVIGHLAELVHDATLKSAGAELTAVTEDKGKFTFEYTNGGSL